MLDPSFIIPTRTVEARQPRARDVAGMVSDGGLSLLLNLAVIGFVIHVSPILPIVRAEPQAISVDLVNEPPGGPTPSGSKAAAASVAPVAQPDPPATPGTPHGAASPLTAAIPMPAASLLPVSPPQTTPAITTPPPSTPSMPLAKRTPTSPPPPASTGPSGLNDAPPATANPPPASSAPAQTPAAPAPLEQNDTVAQPRLVEAPADPRAAKPQADKPVKPNDSPDDDAQPKATATPAAAPTLLTSPDGDDAVPPPQSAPTSTEKAPRSAEEQREADNTAKLAAALPFAQSFAPQTFRGAIPGSGTAASQAYRGAVYGSFHKADALIENARAKHLHGQAVIAFSVDDKGDLVRVAVAVSSGNPEVDQTALDIIKQSAPFPPPPAGASRDFSPAIELGADQSRG